VIELEAASRVSPRSAAFAAEGAKSVGPALPEITVSMEYRHQQWLSWRERVDISDARDSAPGQFLHG
jgi:hypothetical protein